jgi:hypothetical protein
MTGRLRPRLKAAVAADLSGWPGLLLAGLVFVAYGALALAPFSWAPPRRVVNAATADRDSITFPAAGLAYSREALPWLERAAMRGTFRLEVRFRPYSLQQHGPARIFTVSRDLHLANVTLGQQGADLVLRLRRPGSTLNGKPGYIMAGVVRDGRWHEVDITIAPGSLRVTVNGRTALDTTLPEQPLAGWDRGHRVALGSELNGLRTWQGEIARALVDVDGERIDYAGRGALAVPETFWSFANRPTWFLPDEISRHSVKDWIANFVLFAVPGFVLGGRGSWWRALAICSLASLGVEIAQAFFSRHPASMDWLLNTAGAGVGAGIARWLFDTARVTRPGRNSAAAHAPGTTHPRPINP